MKPLIFLILLSSFSYGGVQNSVGHQETLFRPFLLLCFREPDIHTKLSLEVTLRNCFSSP